MTERVPYNQSTFCAPFYEWVRSLHQNISTLPTSATVYYLHPETKEPFWQIESFYGDSRLLPDFDNSEYTRDVAGMEDGELSYYRNGIADLLWEAWWFTYAATSEERGSAIENWDYIIGFECGDLTWTHPDYEGVLTDCIIKDTE